MNKYEKPEIIITEFETEDIMSVSGSVQSPDIDGGSAGFDNSWLGLLS